MTDTPLPLADRTVVITGASSGIGAALADRLSAAGASVVLAARRTERIERHADEIRSRGGAALAVATDVTSADDSRALIAAARDAFGSVDAYVNNAGIARLGRLDEGDLEGWNAMIDVNLRGLLNGLAAVLPVFTEQGHGDVVTIVSTAGLKIVPEMGVYAGSKNAARTVMEALRAESTDGVVRTTEISPGYVRTELADGMDDARRDATRAGMERFGLDPDAVASAVLFVLAQPREVEIGSLTIRPTVQG